MTAPSINNKRVGDNVPIWYDWSEELLRLGPDTVIAESHWTIDAGTVTLSSDGRLAFISGSIVQTYVSGGAAGELAVVNNSILTWPTGNKLVKRFPVKITEGDWEPGTPPVVILPDGLPTIADLEAFVGATPGVTIWVDATSSHPSGNLYAAVPDGNYSSPDGLNIVQGTAIQWVAIDVLDGGTGVIAARRINTTAPLTGGGDLTADRTIAISAATTGAAGSMSSADKTKLDAITDPNLLIRVATQVNRNALTKTIGMRVLTTADMLEWECIATSGGGTWSLKNQPLPLRSVLTNTIDSSVAYAGPGDGVALVNGDLYLLTDEGAGLNGIYSWASGVQIFTNILGSGSVIPIGFTVKAEVGVTEGAQSWAKDAGTTWSRVALELSAGTVTNARLSGSTSSSLALSGLGIDALKATNSGLIVGLGSLRFDESQATPTIGQFPKTDMSNAYPLEIVAQSASQVSAHNGHGGDVIIGSGAAGGTGHDGQIILKTGCIDSVGGSVVGYIDNAEWYTDSTADLRLTLIEHQASGKIIEVSRLPAFNFHKRIQWHQEVARASASPFNIDITTSDSMQGTWSVEYELTAKGVGAVGALKLVWIFSRASGDTIVDCGIQVVYSKFYAGAPTCAQSSPDGIIARLAVTPANASSTTWTAKITYSYDA